MKSAATLLLALCLIAAAISAQTPTPARSFLSRVLHPFGGASNKKAPKYQDPRLRGLVMEARVPAEPVRLSEVRQLHVLTSLTNAGPSPVELDFPTSQRIDIQLLNSSGDVLTRWSENRVFAEEVGSLLINPRENISYDETIATRELQAGKVYTVEVFFPKYPELRVRQKFITAQ